MICSRCEAYTTKPDPICRNCGKPFWEIIARLLANCVRNEVTRAEADEALRIYDAAKPDWL